MERVKVGKAVLFQQKAFPKHILNTGLADPVALASSDRLGADCDQLCDLDPSESVNCRNAPGEGGGYVRCESAAECDFPHRWCR